MASGKLDLDVDAPDQVTRVLRKAAEAYYDSASELESAWQEKAAGRPWTIIARILERAADQIDRKL
jgi:PHD/YefM family antitoxin component YafN of YafNO toxin-antitoxin module